MEVDMILKRNVTTSLKYILVTLTVLLFSGGIPCVLGNAGGIRVGILNNKPIGFIDEKSAAAGIYPDILSAVAEIENLDLVYIFANWPDLLEKLKNGDIDLMTGIVFTPDRDLVFDFSKETVAMVWGQVFTHDQSNIQNILDLDGKKTAILENDINAQNFKKLCRAFDVTPLFEECPNYETLCQWIETRRVEAGIINNINGAFLKRQYQIQPTAILFNPVNGVFATRKDRNPQLLETLDRHLAVWKKDEHSVYYDILNRWYQDMIPSAGVPRRNLLLVILACAVVMLVFLSGIALLKRKINLRTREFQDSEERFRQLAENIREIFWIAMPDFSRLLYLSPKYEELAKHPISDFNKNPEKMLDRIHPDDLDQVREHLEKGITDTVDLEYRVIDPDGEMRWWRNRAFPVKNSENEIYRIVGVAEDITSRKKIEESLLLSRQKMALHLEQTPLAVMELDLDFKIQSWNPAAENIFGYSTHEILGQHISRIVPLQDRKHMESIINNLVQGKGSTRNTNRNINKKGEIIYCEWFNTPVVDESGNIIAFISLGQDITQRVKTQQALKINEKRYRELINNMSSGVAVYTPDETGENFVFQDFNPAAESITGVKREDIIGNDVREAFPGADKAGFLDGFKTAFKEGRTVRIPSAYYQDDRIQLWVEQHVYKLPSGEVVSVFHDISEKKSAETKIQIERDKLQSVINSIGDILYIIGPDRRIEFQNEASRKHIGTLVDKTCYSELFGNTQPCTFCRLEKCLKDASIEQVQTGTLNGKSYEIFFSPFKDTDGSSKAVVLMRDITEKLSLQEEAMRAGHLASLGELAAGVAHEINNPVNGIIGLAEILQDRCEQFGEDDHLPERIINEGERIGSIVRNLLSFARVRKDEFTPVNIDAVIHDTLELVEKQILKEGISIELDLPDDLPQVRANAPEIQQVFINMLSNCKYALKEKKVEAPEKKRIEINTRVLEHDGHLFVRTAFCDNGVGIPKDLQKKVLNPFFSTKPRGEGTGLGLSISHGIVNNHQGRLSINSKEGLYTKIYIDLPVLAEGNTIP